MARAALHKCNTAGCSVLTRERHCERHAKEKRTSPASKQPGDPFYSSTRWRRLRERFLRDNPLCVRCERHGMTTPANEVHHKKPRADCPELEFDWENLEGLCKSCHSRETRKEQSAKRR